MRAQMLIIYQFAITVRLIVPADNYFTEDHPIVYKTSPTPTVANIVYFVIEFKIQYWNIINICNRLITQKSLDSLRNDYAQERREKKKSWNVIDDIKNVYTP